MFAANTYTWPIERFPPPSPACMCSYRGYGRSQKARPDERGLKLDAEAGLRHLLQVVVGGGGGLRHLQQVGGALCEVGEGAEPGALRQGVLGPGHGGCPALPRPLAPIHPLNVDALWYPSPHIPALAADYGVPPPTSWLFPLPLPLFRMLQREDVDASRVIFAPLTPPYHLAAHPTHAPPLSHSVMTSTPAA